MKVLKIGVKIRMTNNEDKTLIFIPKDANYIEILGHRIDGYDGFEAFCEHLKKYAELEETVNHLQSENSKLKKSNRNWRRKVQRLKMKLGIKDLEYSCLERERADDIGEFVEELKSLKIKAYKECIEKIKAESSSCVATDHGIVVAGSRTYTISEVKLYEIEKELENNNAK